MLLTEVRQLAAAPMLRDLRSGRSEPWINTALRTKSPALRNILAEDVLPGSTADELESIVLNDAYLDLLLVTKSAASAAALGTVWAAAGEGLSTMLAGYRLLRAVVHSGPSQLSPRQRQVFAQVAYLLGEFTDVEMALRHLPGIPQEVRRSLETDLLHPKRQSSDVSQWVLRLSAPFVAHGLNGLAVDLEAETLFDGLAAADPPENSDGPKVSVIMPCYRPDAALVTSVRSILAQGHANLEVLLVDDASGPEYAELFEQCEALDERVRLIRRTENGGTYLARNTALRDATGEFISVQDADDWSHPSRIGEQVRALMDNPHAAGSRSDAIRATDDLIHQWVGYYPRRRNASSLMFRRADLERTGPFDSVRKGADSEFHERLVRLVGPVVDTSTPLAVTRLRSGTLSRSDFTYRWMSADRLLYRTAYRSWHRTLHRNSTTTAPTVGDVEDRPFPAPPAFVRGLGSSGSRPEIDVLVVLDSSQPRTCEAAVALAREREDLHFGILHLEDATLGRAHQPEPADVLLTAARAGAVTMVSRTEELAVGTAVVLTPGVLEMPPQPSATLTARRVLAIAQPPSVEAGVMDFVAASDGARLLLGRAPEWCASDEAAQALWDEAGWTMPLVVHELAVPTR